MRWVPIRTACPASAFAETVTGLSTSPPSSTLHAIDALNNFETRVRMKKRAAGVRGFSGVRVVRSVNSRPSSSDPIGSPIGGWPSSVKGTIPSNEASSWERAGRNSGNRSLSKTEIHKPPANVRRSICLRLRLERPPAFALMLLSGESRGPVFCIVLLGGFLGARHYLLFCGRAVDAFRGRILSAGTIPCPSRTL